MYFIHRNLNFIAIKGNEICLGVDMDLDFPFQSFLAVLKRPNRD